MLCFEDLWSECLTVTAKAKCPWVRCHLISVTTFYFIEQTDSICLLLYIHSLFKVGVQLFSEHELTKHFCFFFSVFSVQHLSHTDMSALAWRNNPSVLIPILYLLGYSSHIPQTYHAWSKCRQIFPLTCNINSFFLFARILTWMLCTVYIWYNWWNSSVQLMMLQIMG